MGLKDVASEAYRRSFDGLCLVTWYTWNARVRRHGAAVQGKLRSEKVHLDT